MKQNKKIIAAFDYGEKRIGASVADTDMRIPYALQTFQTADGLDAIQKYLDYHDVTDIIVGNPRNQSGEETQQTAEAKVFAARIYEHTGLPYSMQDESLTSVLAEERLKQHGKAYTKEDIDAHAASIILGDYLRRYE